MTDATPPSVPGVPLLGNSHQVIHPLAFGERCRTLDASVVRARVGAKSMYVVTDPSLVEEVLLTRAECFDKPDMLRGQLASSLGYRLDHDDAAYVSTLRAVWRPVMYSDRLSMYVPALHDVIERTFEELPTDEPVDLLATFRTLTRSMVMATLFDADLEVDEREYGRLVDAISRKYAPKQLVLSLVAPEWVPTPTNRRYRRAVDDLEELVEDVLATSDGGPLLTSLRRAREEGTDVTDETIRTEIGILVVGAIEPLALALTFVCACLAREPATQRRVRTDIDAAGERTATLDTFEGLASLNAVISESLRLYPPIYTMFRRSTRSVRLGGYEIPAESRIWLSQWQLHRDERYFSDPLQFDPDRWLTDDPCPRYAYIPFGGGARQCVGGAFATTIARVVLAHLLQRYTMATQEPVSDPLEVVPELSLVPRDPVELVFRPLE